MCRHAQSTSMYKLQKPSTHVHKTKRYIFLVNVDLGILFICYYALPVCLITPTELQSSKNVCQPPTHILVVLRYFDNNDESVHVCTSPPLSYLMEKWACMHPLIVIT